MLGAQDGHKPHTWTHIRASQRWGHLRGFMSLERGAESQTFSAYVTDFINIWTVENLLGETDCGLQRSQFNVWQLRPHSLLLTLSPAFRKKRLNSVQMHKTLSFRCFAESKRLCEHVFSLFSSLPELRGIQGTWLHIHKVLNTHSVRKQGVGFWERIKTTSGQLHMDRATEGTETERAGNGNYFHKRLIVLSNLGCQIEHFPNLLDLFHVSMW